MSEVKKGVTRIPFHPGDMVRGEDGELYHLPTLRALFAAGRLSPGSVGYLLLVEQGLLHTRRMIA